MRLIFQVIAEERIVICILLCDPDQRILPVLCGDACFAVPQLIVVTGVVFIRAVDVNERLETVLLALLDDDIENLHAVLDGFAVLQHEILVDVCVGACRRDLAVFALHILRRRIGRLHGADLMRFAVHPGFQQRC